ncbi:hypothetical protein K488DRAFT_85125 [Vararia minispora EC-137]|uniref:Uncharacterized protein n=1 Tax=Vararia minispora EC-137 TaxID=1314806 RepID=A0ACB8QMV9_9AGAM|nr:hypothetical protein K488DRAFT_85125 [Vararia minispora EC-137]
MQLKLLAILVTAAVSVTALSSNVQAHGLIVRQNNGGEDDNASRGDGGAADGSGTGADAGTDTTGDGMALPVRLRKHSLAISRKLLIIVNAVTSSADSIGASTIASTLPASGTETTAVGEIQSAATDSLVGALTTTLSTPFIHTPPGLASTTSPTIASSGSAHPSNTTVPVTAAPSPTPPASTPHPAATTATTTAHTNVATPTARRSSATLRRLVGGTSVLAAGILCAAVLL